MCQLLETIKVKHNSLQNIFYHNNRVNKSRKLLFQSKHTWDLSKIIRVPDLDQNTIYRCRFLYGREPDGFEFIPYSGRIVQKLYLVDCGDLEYSFKYADRSELEKLRNSIPDPEISDILMVRKGLITDTSFSNIVLFDDHQWYTPATPILMGTKREFYIDNGIILKRDIKPADIFNYRKARLINAMLDLYEGEDIPVSNII
jgi:4-amino-4-deoxychorismate lyase